MSVDKTARLDRPRYFVENPSKELPFHLFRYLDEQTFRYNNRKDMNDSHRFELAMSHVFGKRLTYEQLTGKNASPHHEATGTRETQVPF
jgi:hypothetical protein